ncbi:MAG: hypothetical protein CO090_04055 [Acidobacteria bacterium CG_4_9_14_3_um_filter_49_7]|nr:MAG: hypothetical protein CO090_04055 [Acidobacteria bacterium CG_4_9_14_3_um_filter_49_7]
MGKTGNWRIGYLYLSLLGLKLRLKLKLVFREFFLDRSVRHSVKCLSLLFEGGRHEKNRTQVYTADRGCLLGLAKLTIVFLFL